MANENAPSSLTANVTATRTANPGIIQPSNAGRKRRSCFMCSKRKVKCDKQKPCHNCAKAGCECVFPDVTASRTQVTMTPELVEMLHRLEKAVQTLEPRDQERSENRPSSVSSSHGESPGKIVRDHGRDTYVRRWFWDDGSTEMSSGSVSDDDYADMQDDQDPAPNASTAWWSTRPGSLELNCHPKEKTLQILAAQRLQLWAAYKERVEPLTKLLHLPSLEQAVMGDRPLSSADGMQCILLAIYYGAITSLTEEECISVFDDGQAQVLSHMREELERMFSRAMLVHTGDIRPLQALVLYLVFLRHHEPRLSWNLTGLAVRLAQNFGLHREGSLFGLSKFDMEMRRRLWWQIAILDAPSAEDYSGEFYLLEMSSFDTQPPQNLDDVQLHPAMVEYPPETRGITEMTFTLARCQITDMFRCMADSRRTCGSTGKSYGELTPEERANWIEACESDFSVRFLRNCSPSNAFHWVTVILTRMLFHKVRLHGCDPLHEAGDMSDATRERLFPVAVEVIELNYKLRTDPRTRPWLWLFSSYTQWHAFSLVLVWLQMDPLCKSSRRAWEAVERAIVLRWEHPRSLLNGRKPQQWRSIIRLLEKARTARQDALSKRTRRGSRHTNDSRRVSARTALGQSSSSTGHSSSTVANTASQQINTQSHFQPVPQPQQLNRASTASSGGPPTPPVAITDVPSDTGLGGMMPSLGSAPNQTMIPDFSIDDISDPMVHSDLMMVDGEFSAEDFQGVQDFSFLDDIF
ncbi:hypothetical protein ACJZ2D_008920 [Fusarium nematophilum]